MGWICISWQLVKNLTVISFSVWILFYFILSAERLAMLDQHAKRLCLFKSRMFFSQVFVHTSAVSVRRPSPSAALWSPTWRRSTVSRSSTLTRSAAASCTSAKSVAILRLPRMHWCATSTLNIRTVSSCGPRRREDCPRQRTLKTTAPSLDPLSHFIAMILGRADSPYKNMLLYAKGCDWCAFWWFIVSFRVRGRRKWKNGKVKSCKMLFLWQYAEIQFTLLLYFSLRNHTKADDDDVHYSISMHYFTLHDNIIISNDEMKHNSGEIHTWMWY